MLELERNCILFSSVSLFKQRGCLRQERNGIRIFKILQNQSVIICRYMFFVELPITYKLLELVKELSKFSRYKINVKINCISIY